MALVELLVVLRVVDGSVNISAKAEKMKADTAGSMRGDVFLTRRDTLDVFLRDGRIFRIVTNGKDIDRYSFCYYSVDGNLAIGFCAGKGSGSARFEVVFKTDGAIISTENGGYPLPNRSSTENKGFSASLQ